MGSDAGQEETVTDVLTLDQDHRRSEHLGLPLAAAKQLLSTLQQPRLQQQVDTFLNPCFTCADCGALLQVKAHARRAFRPWFGPGPLHRPRLAHCDGPPRKTSSFRPLAALLTESVAPELRSMAAKWSSVVSYGMSRDALKDFRPLEAPLEGKTVRSATRKVAKRLAAEWGDEPPRFIDGNPRDWVLLPQPQGAFTGGIAGGYGRHGFDKNHRFEVLGGQRVRSVRAEEDVPSRSPKRLGFVQTLDTKPQRRL
jgi:hypothetical protein